MIPVNVGGADVERIASIISSSLVALLGGMSVASADGYEGGGLKDTYRPAFSWSGVYMGVHGGYGWGDGEFEENLFQVAGIIPNSLSEDFDVDGGFGGVQLGMNKQIGNLVIGGELSLSGAGISGSSGQDCFDIATLTGGFVQADCGAEINWLLTGLARVGYAFDRTLIYGTAGWAVAGIDTSAELSIPLIAGLSLPSGTNDTADGFAFGAGFEYAVTDWASIGVQYLHADLKSDGSGLLLGGILTSGERNIDLDTVSARLNIRWGGTGVASADGYEGGGLKDTYGPAFSWSGVYMGVHGGYGWGDADFEENLFQVAGIIPNSLSEDFDVDGGFGGVQLGMNKQIGNLVIGGELSLSGAGISGSSGQDCFDIATLTGGFVQADCGAEINWLLTGLARVGYAFDRTLIYGTAGWAVAGIDTSAELSIPLIAGLSLPSGTNDTADGFAFGAGFEYAVTDWASIGVQYLHADLKSDGSGLLLGGILTSGERNIDLDTVSARLNFRWGGTGVASADGYEGGGLKDTYGPAFSWSGVYMGVHGGYGWGDADFEENLFQVAGIIPNSLSEDFDVDGGFGGVQLGMNKQIGNLVIGGELSLSGAEISGSSGRDCFNIATLTAGFVEAGCDAELNWLLTGLARVGYAFDRTMIYGTAGWAVAGIDYNAELNIPLIAGLSLPSGANDTADGFAFGAGFEYAVADWASIGVQYLHADLKSDGSGLLLGGILTSGERDIDLDTASARLNIRWGGN